MSTTNPLIAESPMETARNATEALDAVACLLAESQDPRYRNVFVMLSPITHALAHATADEAEA